MRTSHRREVKKIPNLQQGSKIFSNCKASNGEMSSPGLILVFEGKRTRVKIFRRYFFPIKARDEHSEIVVYNDTQREREITYRRAEQYGLDNPIQLTKMVKLAKAMKVLQTNTPTSGVQNLQFTICRRSELIGPEVENDDWTPFDSTRLRPLDERVKDALKRAKWRARLRKR